MATLVALAALVAGAEMRPWSAKPVAGAPVEHASPSRSPLPPLIATRSTFAPGGSEDWQYGPDLGRTAGDDQWFSAYVSGLGSNNHVAGARLRHNGQPDAGNENSGVLVAVCIDSFVVEAADVDFEHGPLRVAREGLLRISITADNLVTVAFNGEVVLTRQLHEQYRAGRGLIAAAWQMGPGVRLSDIRTNVVGGDSPSAVAPS